MVAIVLYRAAAGQAESGLADADAITRLVSEPMAAAARLAPLLGGTADAADLVAGFFLSGYRAVMGLLALGMVLALLGILALTGKGVLRTAGARPVPGPEAMRILGRIDEGASGDRRSQGGLERRAAQAAAAATYPQVGRRSNDRLGRRPAWPE